MKRALTTNMNNSSTSRSNTAFVIGGVVVMVPHWWCSSLGVHSVLNSMDPLAFQCPCHGVDTPSAALIRYRTFLTTINSAYKPRIFYSYVLIAIILINRDHSAGHKYILK